MKTLLCEICRTPIAQFDPIEVSVPLTGAMFKPLYMDRECNPTWLPSIEQDDLVCPMCKRRVFNDPHRLLTSDGYMEVEDSVPFRCPYCGKVCGSEIGLKSHMRHKHKDETNG